MIIEDGKCACCEEGDEDGEGDEPAHAWLGNFCILVSVYPSITFGSVCKPGSSRSERRSINGPSPSLGADTNVLLAIIFLPATLKAGPLTNVDRSPIRALLRGTLRIKRGSILSGED